MANTIPRSRVKLYIAPDLIEDKNLIIDDIETYLSGLTSTNELECQYIKHGKRITLKLNMTEEKQTSLPYTYCKIVNVNEGQDEKKIYYYIDNIKPLAQNTIELELICDGLNTYNGNRTFKNTTHVTRKHKDRFYSSAVVLDKTKVPMKVDKYPEDFAVNEKIIYSKSQINPTQIEDKDLTWELCFNSETIGDTQVVKTYLAPSKNLSLTYPTYYSNVLNDVDRCCLVSDLVDNYSLINFFTENYTEDEINNYAIYLKQNYTFKWGFNSRTCSIYALGLKQINNYKALYIIYKDTDNNFYGGYFSYINKSTKAIHITPIWLPTEHDHINTLYDAIEYYRSGPITTVENRATILTYSSIHTTTAFATQALHPFSNTVRKLSTVNSIVELPYSPIPIVDNTTLADHYITEYTLTFGTGDFQYTTIVDYDLSKALNNNNFQFSLEMIKNLNTAAKIQNKNSIYETKLHNSAIESSQIVYDTESIEIEKENLHFNTDSPDNEDLLFGTFWVDPILARSIGLRLNSIGNEWTYKNKDINKFVLNSNRDNTSIVYNSSYLNYIQNGYNYDIASNKLAAIQGAVGILQSGSAAQAAGKAVGLGFNLINQDITMNAKLASLAGQTANIVGSTGLNSLKFAQGKNKFYYVISGPNDTIKQAIFEYFYQKGYATDEYGVPITQSRIWFDFLQCEPEFTYDIAIDKAIRDEVVNKYKEGVTYIHKYNNTYDLTFTKENWEISFVAYLN